MSSNLAIARRFVFAMILCASASSAPRSWAVEDEGEVTRCDDQASWDSLEGLREKYKGTDGEGDVEFLYRLRKFICVEIETGRLTYRAAEPLFDSQRERIIREWKATDDNPARPPT